uniref:Uncharacterized protein n=1 Tax=Glossina pallidipes TaxID=7398 RepID=A0A1B0A045_GLOPL
MAATRMPFETSQFASESVANPQNVASASTATSQQLNAERPSTLLNIEQVHTASAHHHNMNSPLLSPSGSSPGSGAISPSFVPEIPKWKRDLIQRRKQNVARTLNACSPTGTGNGAGTGANFLVGAVATDGFNTSIFSSPRSVAGSNNNLSNDLSAAAGKCIRKERHFNNRPELIFRVSYSSISNVWS